MPAIEVRPVSSRHERRVFLTFPWHVYRDDPIWVPPLIPERAKVIDPQRGVWFRRGSAELFVAWDHHTPVGTICAAEDPTTNQARSRRDCVFGFFECVPDESVARALIDTAAAWAREHDLDALYGPFNLDYEDGYGVLIEGRDRPPAVFCGHTPPYYRDLVEGYGFVPARGDNLAFAADLTRDTPALRRLTRLARRVRERSDILVRDADLGQWDSEVNRIHHLLNTALRHLPDFIPWQRDALDAMLRPFRDIADPELVLFAEIRGRTVGWFPGIPNLNEAFIRVDGLRHPWDFLRLWAALRHRPRCLAIKSVLVEPDLWDTGVSVLLFDEMVRRARAKGYSWLDLSLTSDDNPRTPVLAHHMGAQIYKRYRVYRKPLSPSSVS
ncbi:MAG: GNAT family N-acetyltransferase [Chloroflexi bacterium]|nr:GNAT family N-acetyltransferase [Chloroflexota bacterium]